MDPYGDHDDDDADDCLGVTALRIVVASLPGCRESSEHVASGSIIRAGRAGHLGLLRTPLSGLYDRHASVKNRHAPTSAGVCVITLPRYSEISRSIDNNSIRWTL